MTTPTPLDQDELQRRLPEIEAELELLARHRASERTRPIAAALRNVFDRLFPGRNSSRDRVQFFVFVAPLMRRLTIEAGRAGAASGTLNLNAFELDQWLTRLAGFDPECALMIDLRYFTGLTTRETAGALGLSPQAVIRDLRFAKAWLQARIRWVGERREP